MRSLAFVQTSHNNGQGDVQEYRAIISGELEKAKESFAEIPMSRVLREQLARVNRLIPNAGTEELLTMVREFLNNLTWEMGGHLFLVIRDDRREFYEQREPSFGGNVAAAFADANRDIAGSARCFALDEWTACVFHLMRALEYGLRQIGKEVGLTEDETSHENWKNIIDRIEAKIRDTEKLPKSSEKIAHLKVLSSAATQFRYFKDAWRNHVAHAHVTYDEREATTVFTHVKAFLEGLARDAVERSS